MFVIIDQFEPVALKFPKAVNIYRRILGGRRAWVESCRRLRNSNIQHTHIHDRSFCQYVHNFMQKEEKSCSCSNYDWKLKICIFSWWWVIATQVQAGWNWMYIIWKEQTISSVVSALFVSPGADLTVQKQAGSTKFHCETNQSDLRRELFTVTEW